MLIAFLPILMICFAFSLVSGEDWGVIRYAHSTVNIRNIRSSKDSSKVVAQLKRGQQIKADFLQNNWYAVFEVNESIRDEANAIGYIYASLLKPVPPSKEQLQAPKSGMLKYRVVAKEDASYRGSARMRFRVVVIVNKLPTKAQLKQTAINIWQDGNKGWKEFYVCIYLPGMDTKAFPYGNAEFSQNGLKSFKLQDFALAGTKWSK